MRINRGGIVFLRMFCPIEDCEASWLLRSEREPDDPNYGADADGNRGMFVRGDIVPGDLPKFCPVCEATYDKGDIAGLEHQLGSADVEPDPSMLDKIAE